MAKYFTMAEMLRSDTARELGIDNTPNARERANIEKTMALLDKIREKWGSPIIVTSGFRCNALNEAIGGSSTSQHPKGEAADIKPKKGTVRALFNMIAEMIRNNEIEVGQLIDEYHYSWVHVSVPYKKKNQILHLP